jgi:acetylornithine deacetylase
VPDLRRYVMTQATATYDRVVDSIDALRDDGVKLLQGLVRINSVNPSFPGVNRALVIGGESLCNEFLHSYYERAGLETHWVSEDPERRNLVGVRPGVGGGRSLLLDGHIDTVPPVEPESWITGSPWKPEIRDGYLYGLGSTDMKGSITAMWLAAQGIHDANVPLRGDVHLQSVVGEETMEHGLGTSACLRAGFRADAAIVTEPTSSPRPLTISPIAAGNWHFRIIVRGKSTHSGNRAAAIRPGGPGDEIGVNALEKGIKIVLALQELETQWGMNKNHPYFPPGFFTLLPGVFYSDPGVPVPYYFPNRAEIEYVAWYAPQDSADSVKLEIEDYVIAACQVDPWLRAHPPEFQWLKNWPEASTPWEHPIVRTMVQAHEAVTGQSVPDPSPQHPIAFGAASDASFLEAEGIPTLVYGPGDLSVAHCKNERVSLEEVIVAAKSLAIAVIEWCGTSE